MVDGADAVFEFSPVSKNSTFMYFVRFWILSARRGTCEAAGRFASLPSGNLVIPLSMWMKPFMRSEFSNERDLNRSKWEGMELGEISLRVARGRKKKTKKKTKQKKTLFVYRSRLRESGIGWWS